MEEQPHAGILAELPQEMVAPEGALKSKQPFVLVFDSIMAREMEEGEDEEPAAVVEVPSEQPVAPISDVSITVIMCATSGLVSVVKWFARFLIILCFLCHL